MSNSTGGFVIQRASESRNEFWTGSGWSENETDARRFAAEPNAGEVAGDESATVTRVADQDRRARGASQRGGLPLNDLEGYRVAVLATDGFEETELTAPVAALKSAGAEVTIISPNAGKIQGFVHATKGHRVAVDKRLGDASPHDFDAVHLPGGCLNADAMRTIPEVQKFLQGMQAAAKPMAAICHAPWELISAGLMQGRTLTSYHTIQDDVRNAGGKWMDRTVVEDQNWVTSRQPEDLPAFNRAMINLFERQHALAIEMCGRLTWPSDAVAQMPR